MKKRTKEEIATMIEEISEEIPEALFADGLEEAILGVAQVFGKEGVVAYEYEACLEVFMAGGMTYDEAEEWMSFNVMGAYVGEYTPIFVRTFRDVADPAAVKMGASAALDAPAGGQVDALRRKSVRLRPKSWGG